jgi:hypothetical protein
MMRQCSTFYRAAVLALCAIATASPALAVRNAASAEAPPATANNVREIIVVCKTHFDIGYTHRVKDLLSYYRTTMIDRALDIMDQSETLPPEQQFVWNAPGWVMNKVLQDWPGQTLARRERLEAAMRSGKFVTHALPFTIEAELMEPEQFARGYLFADAIARKYGLPLARAAKTTDVPAQSRSLATGLAQGGVKFMHIGCNSACTFPAYPPLFWWEGPDGSRVLTMYSGSYGTCDALYPRDWLCTKDPSKDGCLGHNLLPPPGWPYKTWVAIIVTPDNSGPPKMNEVKALFTDVARRLPGVKVRMGTMEEFADAIIAEAPDLPVVRNEMPDTWIHGCMSDPGGARIARHVGTLLPAVELLNTQLRLWGVPVANPARDIAGAYERSLLYCEHTWGGAEAVDVYGDAFQKLPPERYKSLEGSWEDKTDYIRTAGNIARSLLAANLDALAKAVDRAGPRVVVYNPLPWPRSGIVEIAGGRLEADRVPACGYKTFPVPAASPPMAVSGGTIENEFFTVRLDPARGTIVSLVDRRSGREWVDAKSDWGLGQYLNERFSAEQTLKYVRDYQNGRTDFGGKREWLHPAMYKPGLPADVPYRAATGRNGTLTVTRDALSQTAVMDMPADVPHHVPATSLRVTLHRGQPYLDIELTIHDKAKDNWPEADWVCLPLKIDSPQFRVGRNLGVMDPATDIQRGANRDLYAVGTGVTLTGTDGAGVAVCPLDHPLVSLGRPGIWKFSLDFIPKKPVLFLNLYNNQWNTNYRYWYPGTWSSRVRLWTFASGTAVGEALITPSLEARHPLEAAAAQGPGGPLPPSRSGLELSRKGVLVTAFTPTLIRVWEQAGTAGEVVVTGLKAGTATPLNLRGERIGNPIPINAGKLRFNLGAFAPASFALGGQGSVCCPCATLNLGKEAEM